MSARQFLRAAAPTYDVEFRNSRGAQRGMNPPFQWVRHPLLGTDRLRYPEILLKPTDERLREVFNTLELYIEERYGIAVIIKDVPEPFTGDLDGCEIHVDYANDVETAVFIIAHLFGHTVQWNLSEYARKIGYEVQQNPSEEKLNELEGYEREACRYSLRLFHDAGVHDLDQWVADFAACDFAYLRYFYKTGRKKPFRSFWRDGQPLLEPLPIPDFSPTHWISRWQGIVV